MKNLKRIFSLALAGTMLAGMLTIGASAANFTDAEDIKNDDAVNFMVALNIINGKDDGSFDPEATVTRAEMAKMITIALNGGKEPVLGTLATPSYTDIKGNWAEKYIEYCSNLGIIGGRGNGTFDPSGTVTGTEAAKMVLVAMGYNSEIHGFTGADWSTNVNIAANNAQPNKLYKGLESIDPSKGLSRDNAAQLLYNGVQDDMMIRQDSLTVQDGKITFGYILTEGKSILTEKYGYKVEYGFVDGVSYNEDSEDYDISIDGTVAPASGGARPPAFGALVADKRAKFSGTSVTFGEDLTNLYGQQVKVVYNDDDEALGIYAVDTTVESTVVGKLPSSLAATSTSVKVNGTTYKFDGTNKDAQGVPVYEVLANGTYAAADDLAALNGTTKEYAIDLIDNDGNGRINCVVIHPVTLAKVTYKGAKSITVTTVGSMDLEDDVHVYEDIKKDDWVIVTDKADTADGKYVVEKAEIVEGTIDNTKDLNSTNSQIRVDGNWYSKATVTPPVSGGLTPSQTQLNKDVKLVLINGYYGYAEADKAVSNDLLVITNLADDHVSFSPSTYEAKVAFTDGTTKTTKVRLAEGEGGSLTIGKFYSYDLDGDVYELTTATTTNTNYDKALSTAAYVPSASGTPAKVGGENIADDAVVIVSYYADSTVDTNSNSTPDNEESGALGANASGDLNNLTKVKIITGKQLKSWNAAAGTTVTAGFASKINGVQYAQVVFVAFDSKDLPNEKGSTKYGYVVATSILEKDGSDTNAVYTIWNGSEDVEVREKTANASPVERKAGTAISYEDLGNGKIGNVNAVTATGAIMGYNAADEIINIDGTDITMEAKDAVVIYINSKDKVGVESNDIPLATELPTGAFAQNVIYKTSGTPTSIDVLFIDVNNELDGVGAVVAEVEKPQGADKSAATLFAGKANGVYTLPAGTTSTEVTGLSTNATDLGELLFFKFKTTATASTEYTLTIKKAGTQVYTEKGSVTDGEHFFYVWADASGKWTTSQTGVTYTYTITGGTGADAVSEKGTFQL